MTKTRQGDAAAAQFIEGMGQLFEADGFARISGRILGCLMLSAEARSLQELADELKVSRASVSNNTRLLEQLGALERVTLPGDRRDYYRIAEDVHDRMLEIRLARFRSTRRLLTTAKRTKAARDVRVSERVKQFSSFFSHMEEAISQTRTKWEREAKRERGGAQRKKRT
jgi:DNA-binding transcriptional regulator GbsR (MarR family)